MVGGRTYRNDRGDGYGGRRLYWEPGGRAALWERSMGLRTWGDRRNDGRIRHGARDDVRGRALQSSGLPRLGDGVLDYDQATSYIRESDRVGEADSKDNTVTYSGSDVVIDMVAVQPGHDDQTFEVHGLTNPTLVVPLGAVVHLNLVNMDYGNTMEHGVILTPVPPPYPYMLMMATGPGLAEVMPLLPWRSAEPVQSAQYASLGAAFVARQPGTYWYVAQLRNTPKRDVR